MKIPNHLGYILSLCLLVTMPPNIFAGAYIFAGESNGIDIVTHPSGYNGTGGELTVTVGIDPSSAFSAEMVISIQNIVKLYNELQPTLGNLLLGSANDLASNQIDFESVALHEIGHCVGMAHVNAATESGLSGANLNYTKATNGTNNIFDVNSGADGIIGTNDDVRGDDINLHWYQIANNNPFTIASVIDSTTYARDLSTLPSGDLFAVNADRAVSSLLGLPLSESVMQQGTFSDEAQRHLVHDDVATLKYAMTGLDSIANTQDDYTINLVFLGTTNSADIIIDFDNNQTGFAVCQTGGAFLSANHAVITSAKVYFNSGFNWHFNQTEIQNNTIRDDMYIIRTKNNKTIIFGL